MGQNSLKWDPQQKSQTRSLKKHISKIVYLFYKQISPHQGKTLIWPRLLPKNYLSVLDHFMGSAFKGVKRNIFRKYLFHSTKKEVQIREQFYVPKAICNDSNSVFLVL